MNSYKIGEQFNNLFDEEAKRVMKILLDMYNKKIKVNKPFPKLVKELIKDEFKVYNLSILSKIPSFIPLNLMICPTNEWVFVTKEEFDCMIKREAINNLKFVVDDNENLIKRISRKIIDNYDNDNLCKKNILEIVYNYIPYEKLFERDTKAITYIIENVIFNISNKYKITNINPLIIEGL